jgi:23S rRNA pseudouridine1911/1915/1917 synthase
MAKAGKLDIIFEDEYMIACVKPFGVSSQPDNGSGEDMMTTVKNYLYEEGLKNGVDEEPYLAVINRLDRPVSGIVLYAKTEEMAASLSDLLQSDGISKYYQAVVTGFMDEPEGTLTDWILFDKKTNVSKIVSPDTKGAKKAELNYEVLDELDTDEGPISYLLIELLTGRHHQIRCQLAHAGCGIWGDIKYNNKFKAKAGRAAKSPAKAGKEKGKVKAGKGIGLFSTMLEFTHPVTGEEISLHREPEGEAFEIIDQMDW